MTTEKQLSYRLSHTRRFPIQAEGGSLAVVATKSCTIPIATTIDELRQRGSDDAQKEISLEAVAKFMNSNGVGVDRKLSVPLGGHKAMEDYQIRHRQFLSFAEQFLNNAALLGSFTKVALLVFPQVTVGVERAAAGGFSSSITIGVGGEIGSATFTETRDDLLHALHDAIDSAYRGQW